MKVEVERFACDFVKILPLKSRRIILSHVHRLEEPESAPDVERLGKNVYRMHVGHTYTVFFCIVHVEGRVHMTDILPIEIAHKRYWRYR